MFIDSRYIQRRNIAGLSPLILPAWLIFRRILDSFSIAIAQAFKREYNSAGNRLCLNPAHFNNLRFLPCDIALYFTEISTCINTYTEVGAVFVNGASAHR
jgi:hypothetical protein